MNPIDITTAEPFKSLFPVEQALAIRIEHDMRKRGYDPASPIIIWAERQCVLDGHTRRAAAIACGIADVPVVERSFDTENEAVLYAINCQKNRRNLTDADLMRLVEEVDKRLTKSEAAAKITLSREATQTQAQHCASVHSAGKSAARTASAIGTSTRKVELTRQVIDHADDETMEAVRSGDLSINAATKRIKAAKETQATDYVLVDRFMAVCGDPDEKREWWGKLLRRVGKHAPTYDLWAYVKSSEKRAAASTPSSYGSLLRQKMVHHLNGVIYKASRSASRGQGRKPLPGSPPPVSERDESTARCVSLVESVEEAMESLLNERPGPVGREGVMAAMERMEQSIRAVREAMEESDLAPTLATATEPAVARTGVENDNA